MIYVVNINKLGGFAVDIVANVGIYHQAAIKNIILDFFDNDLL